MSGMVERVAKAVWRCELLLDAAECMQAARAAIEAMREPTEAMVKAGESVECEGSSGYRAMIDAALAEPGDA